MALRHPQFSLTLVNSPKESPIHFDKGVALGENGRDDPG